MTPEQRAALEELVPESERTGDDTADLLAAIRESGRRREENSRQGGAVIEALYDMVDPETGERLWSWRELARETGIPQATLRRWAGPPLTEAAVAIEIDEE